MDHSDIRPPVRLRRRPIPHPGSADPKSGDRLFAQSADPGRKKRLPNSGSFKKGQPSPNPNGRPKGAKGKKALTRKILLERVTVRLPNGSKKLSVFEALLLKERDLAFSGDWRARKTILELGRWALPDDLLEEAGVGPISDPETDRAIVEWFQEEVRQKERQKRKGGK